MYQEHEDFTQRKKTLSKEVEPLIIALENKLHQYFTEQNTKLIKVRMCVILSHLLILGYSKLANIGP